MSLLFKCFVFALLSSCQMQVLPEKDEPANDASKEYVTEASSFGRTDTIPGNESNKDKFKAEDHLKSEEVTAGSKIDVGSVNPDELIEFAETLVGIPYAYGSSDPKVGFDCSGFITYVFNHFRIKVPRSSSQFLNVGKTIPAENALRGDLILFTDPDFTNTNSEVVGHMGLILSNKDGEINFIHSTSGKAKSVIVTPFNDHYKKRFVRVGRIFPQRMK